MKHANNTIRSVRHETLSKIVYSFEKEKKKEEEEEEEE